jgi:hypothetical protein
MDTKIRNGQILAELAITVSLLLGLFLMVIVINQKHSNILKRWEYKSKQKGEISEKELERKIQRLVPEK